MSKKKEGAALQIEVETQKQWAELLRLEGLVVVDVYASWAGPCMSMVNILKRVKVEVNDERLWLAVACSDKIAELAQYRDHSEPCWLFLGGGNPVKVMHGSNAPELVKSIKKSFAFEILCMEGKGTRQIISLENDETRRLREEAAAAALAAEEAEEEEELSLRLDMLRRMSRERHELEMQEAEAAAEAAARGQDDDDDDMSIVASESDTVQQGSMVSSAPGSASTTQTGNALGSLSDEFEGRDEHDGVD